MPDEQQTISAQQLLQTIGEYEIGSRVMRATIQQQAQQIDALAKELTELKAKSEKKKPQLVEKQA